MVQSKIEGSTVDYQNYKIYLTGVGAASSNSFSCSFRASGLTILSKKRI